MDAAVAVLEQNGWKYSHDMKFEYMKPVYTRRKCKAMVGRTWVTFWRLASEECVEDLESVKTDDLSAVRDMAR